MKPMKMKKVMSNKFDELTKGLAQSTTRRAALRKFGVGLAGAVLAALGLRSNASAQTKTRKINCAHLTEDCARLYPPGSPAYQGCVSSCGIVCSQGLKFCTIG